MEKTFNFWKEKTLDDFLLDKNLLNVWINDYKRYYDTELYDMLISKIKWKPLFNLSSKDKDFNEINEVKNFSYRLANKLCSINKKSFNHLIKKDLIENEKSFNNKDKDNFILFNLFNVIFNPIAYIECNTKKLTATKIVKKINNKVFSALESNEDWLKKIGVKVLNNGFDDANKVYADIYLQGLSYLHKKSPELITNDIYVNCASTFMPCCDPEKNKSLLVFCLNNKTRAKKIIFRLTDEILTNTLINNDVMSVVFSLLSPDIVEKILPEAIKNINKISKFITINEWNSVQLNALKSLFESKELSVKMTDSNKNKKSPRL